MPTSLEYQKHRDYYKRYNKVRYVRMKEYFKNWRQENKIKCRTYCKRRRDNRRQWIKKLKESSPCQDCNKFYPSVCMDFDHRNPNEKITNVGRMMAMPRVLIELEIAKCDLVCSNCHRIRTSKRV